MNEQFVEYTRSASFRLSLSNAQIRHLDFWVVFGNNHRGHPPYDVVAAKLSRNYDISTLNALVRKGLLRFVMDEGFSVTDEGFMTHELLVAAGFCEKAVVNEKTANPQEEA